MRADRRPRPGCEPGAAATFDQEGRERDDRSGFCGELFAYRRVDLGRRQPGEIIDQPLDELLELSFVHTRHGWDPRGFVSCCDRTAIWGPPGELVAS